MESSHDDELASDTQGGIGGLRETEESPIRKRAGEMQRSKPLQVCDGREVISGGEECESGEEREVERRFKHGRKFQWSFHGTVQQIAPSPCQERWGITSEPHGEEDWMDIHLREQPKQGTCEESKKGPTCSVDDFD
ncbi:MAG: hypothetical protein SGPRY_006237 [Prymnesium sp.]